MIRSNNWSVKIYMLMLSIFEWMLIHFIRKIRVCVCVCVSVSMCDSFDKYSNYQPHRRQASSRRITTWINSSLRNVSFRALIYSKQVKVGSTEVYIKLFSAWREVGKFPQTYEAWRKISMHLGNGIWKIIVMWNSVSCFHELYSLLLHAQNEG